jgi:hypothetical protein
MTRAQDARQWRKKPVVIEAMRLDYGCDLNAIRDWMGGEKDRNIKFSINYLKYQITIHTLEGMMTADPGDWIIRGVKGEFYPCKPDIFEATYERPDEQDAAARCAQVEARLQSMENLLCGYHLSIEGTRDTPCLVCEQKSEVTKLRERLQKLISNVEDSLNAPAIDGWHLWSNRLACNLRAAIGEAAPGREGDNGPK